jgi:ferredoxin
VHERGLTDLAAVDDAVQTAVRACPTGALQLAD